MDPSYPTGTSSDDSIRDKVVINKVAKDQ